MDIEDMKAILSALPPRFLCSNLYGTEEINAASRVILNKSPFRYHGPHCLHETDKFENEICTFSNINYALALNSGTGGLMCALHALDVGPGDEVIIPGFLWVAVINAIVLRGAIPVLCEIDYTLNMDPHCLRNIISPRTKAVICVHMIGAPARIEEIKRICADRSISLIEDYSQAHGASVNGRKVGTFGEIGIASLQADKMISSGEGGILITNEKTLYLRAQARHDVGYARVEGIASGTDEYLTFGEGRRLNEISSAIMREQLKKLPAVIRNLCELKARIKRGLKKYSLFKFREIIDEQGDTGSTLVLIFKEKQLLKRFLEAKSELFPYDELFAWPLEKTGHHVYYNCTNLVNKLPALPDGFPWNHPLNRGIKLEYAKGTLPRTDDIIERSVGTMLPGGITAVQAEAILEGFQIVLDRMIHN